MEDGVLITFGEGYTTPDENALELEAVPPKLYTFSFSIS